MQAEEADVVKECAVCGKSYALRFYQVQKNSVDGRCVQCRGCVYEDKQRRR